MAKEGIPYCLECYGTLFANVCEVRITAHN